jgi:hypothetical protein
MLTDSRKIGYTNPWVRPPVELYGLNPVTSNDGIDASYRLRVGTSSNTFQVTAGWSDTRFPNGTSYGVVKSRDLASFVDTFEHGFVTARANWGRARVSIGAFDPLFEGFRAFGAEGAAIADRYEPTDRLITFGSVGASYDPGRFFVMAEWNRTFGNALLTERAARYVSGGYRFGKVTPYLTLAQAEADDRSDPGLTTSALPPPLLGPALGLNAALDRILSAKPVQKTISLGARWDFAKNTAFKLQYDHSSIAAGSSGTLANLQPGFKQGGNFNLLSATIDVVF